MNFRPTVSVAIPVLDEAAHIGACLDAVESQTYPEILEVLVIDGGSTDGTPDLARGRSGVTLVSNPRRLQAFGLNLALDLAGGEMFVRIDGHCVVAADYVQQCVRAVNETGAAVVGGAMRPIGNGWLGAGIAAAMRSRLGAGPARFHIGGPSRWTDTVYLGAYRTQMARLLGGYSAMDANEDAEFAIRMRNRGGIWYDERIRSSYVPRASLVALGRQFFRYGRGRALTARRHPKSVKARQLASPMLLLGLCSPWRKEVALVYVAMIALRAAGEGRGHPLTGLGMALAMPTMHLSWGLGFFIGLARDRRSA